MTSSVDSAYSSLPTVLITGAAQGLGRSIAVAIAGMKKYKLSLIDIKSLDTTVTLCKGVNEFVEIRTFQFDLCNDAKLSEAIAETASRFGPLSSLVNNAALIYLQEIDTDAGLDLDRVDVLLNLNLRAAIRSCALCVPHIKRTKLKYGPSMNCTILNMCSRSSTARKIGAGDGIYASTKWGLLGFSECLFDEVREHGIKVSTILPGWANTAQPAQDFGHRLDWSKCVQPSDVGQAVEFILNCSETVCPFKMCLWPQRDPLLAKPKPKPKPKTKTQSLSAKL